MSNTQEGRTVDEYDDLLTTVLASLEVEGVDRDSHRLYDVVETEALEQLIEGGNDSVAVSATVRKFRMVVTPTTVSVTDREPLDQI